MEKTFIEIKGDNERNTVAMILIANGYTVKRGTAGEAGKRRSGLYFWKE